MQFEEISAVIPSASKMQQLECNMNTEKMDNLLPENMRAIKVIYKQYIKVDVHTPW